MRLNSKLGARCSILWKAGRYTRVVSGVQLFLVGTYSSKYRMNCTHISLGLRFDTGKPTWCRLSLYLPGNSKVLAAKRASSDIM